MPVELFDTHCHLTFKELLPQCDRVIADAVRVGVSHLLTVTCRPGEVEEALAIRKRHPELWISTGIHPHEADKVGDGDLCRLVRSWQEPGVVAAGEMGLDYHYDFSPRQAQQSVFHRQLESASAAGLPVVIHCREAHDEVVRILTAHGYVGRAVVFHCFSGNAEQAAELRANGWWTSFTGIITFKNAADLRQVCVDTPQDQLIFETDSPYLSPEPVRQMRPNKPQNIIHTVRFAAELRGQSFETLAETSAANALRFFDINSTRR